MKVSLVVVKGKREGKVLPISVPQFLIGRHKECQLRASSTQISQHHCAILVKQDKVVVHDFDSTNGTFVNHRRVEGEQELASDDLLELGRLAFRIRIDVDEDKLEAPPGEPKSDESFIGEMLLSTSEAEGGILGLMEDSSCGSTIMRKPDIDKKDLKDSEREASNPEADDPPKSEEEGNAGEEPTLPAGPSDEIAKKLLEEFHRTVYAKHNPPS